MQEPRPLQKFSLWYFQKPWLVPYVLLYNLFSSPFLLSLLLASLHSTMSIWHHRICMAPLALLLGTAIPSCHSLLLGAEDTIVATYIFFLSLMYM